MCLIADGTSSVCIPDSLKMLIPSSFLLFSLFHRATWVSVILSDSVFYFLPSPYHYFFPHFLHVTFYVRGRMAHSAEACQCSLGMDLLRLNTETRLPWQESILGLLLPAMDSHAQLESLHVECLPQNSTLAVHPYAFPPYRHRHATRTTVCCLNWVCTFWFQVFSSLFL